MDKTLIIVIVIVLALLGIGTYYVFVTNSASTVSQMENNSNNTQNQAKGTLYFTVTDAAADMQNVTAVNATIDKVEVFSNIQGWVTVSTTPKTFSLLELKAKSQAELLAKADVDADTYSQVRLHVARILVTESGEVKEAKMPSSELKINTRVMVNGNTDSVARFDIMADKSMHKTGKGEFIFAPVIKFDSSSDATVNIDSNNVVNVTGGKIDASVNVGMNVDGEMKSDFMLDSKLDIKINSGVIELNAGAMFK